MGEIQYDLRIDELSGGKEWVDDGGDDEVIIPRNVMVGIGIGWAIVGASVINMVILDPLRSPYYTFGPSDELRLFPTDILIDTWLKYTALVAYLFLAAFLSVISADFVIPWINTVALNTERTVAFTPREKRTVFIAVNVYWLATACEGLVVIGTSLSQIDFAIASAGGGMLGGFYSCYVVLFRTGKSINDEEREGLGGGVVPGTDMMA